MGRASYQPMGGTTAAPLSSAATPRQLSATEAAARAPRIGAIASWSGCGGTCCAALPCKKARRLPRVK